MSQYTYQPAAASTGSNSIGVAGFVCSLVGLVFTGGLLSPIGLILSLVGLGREPRGFAIAGVILGGLGVCGWGLAWLALGGLIVAAVAVFLGLAVLAEPQKFEVTAEMAILAAAVESERERTGQLPLGLTGIGIQGSALIDPWGNPYRLVIDAGGRDYDIMSDGPDTQADTADDISLHNLDKLWNSPGAVQITAGDDEGTVRVKVGSRTLTVTGDDDGGHVRLDTGERVIEIRGDDNGGRVTVEDAPPAKSDKDTEAPAKAPPPPPAAAPPPVPPTPPADPGT